MKAKLKKAWRWCKENVFKKDIIVWVIIAIIFWSPVIVSFILGSFNAWWYGVGSAFILFWAGFTPAVPLQIGLAIGLRKIYIKTRLRSNNMKIDFETDNIHIWIKEYLEAF